MQRVAFWNLQPFNPKLNHYRNIEAHSDMAGSWLKSFGPDPEGHGADLWFDFFD
jgi:hypothetical protein